MILQVSPQAPFLVRAAADTALVLHIGGASLGMISGAVAMLARKGGRLHRGAGTVFFVAMLAMSGVGSIVAPMFPDRISGAMGLFTFYLTLTAWAAVKRPPGRIGRFETGAMLLGVAAVAAFLSLAWMGVRSPGGLLDGQPAALGFVFGGVAALAVACDLGMIRRGGVSGPARTARHLWRMSLALFIAWGSFAGQPRAQPEALRGSPWLFLPALAVLALLAFWMIRVRVVPTLRRAARPPTASAGA
ncbi:MAG: hypothetical protein JWP86_230 [Phenylobacterium sp.]|nr:hypothetical protein [Phenylobacterium sp.]